MKRILSRRKMVKSMTGISLGAGISSLMLNNSLAYGNTAAIEKQISVKVSPPGPNSRALLQDIKKYVGRTNYTGLYGIGLKGGNGVYIEDLDGNVYMDCLTAASTTILGYSHDEIAQVYYDTAVKLQQTVFAYSPNIETVEFAKKLVRIAPGNFPQKALIGLSGSDSSGAAIEAARKYTQKMGIISFDFAYHGTTGLSQAASGFNSLKEGVYDLNDPNFLKVPFPVTQEGSERTLKSIESILAFGRTAAVMVEIIQGDGGTLLTPEGFYPRLREMLDQYNVLLIDDEIQSGMGRTGKWWAADHEGIVPDITVIGKGLSAGYAPVSAVIGREEVIDSLVPGTQIFSYVGHAPSVAAASRVIDIIEENHLIENAQKIGDRLLAGLKEAEKYPDVVVEARGRGCMIGMEINLANNLQASKIFAFRCVEKGVYFGYIGDKQRVIRVLPPIILNENECDKIIEVVHETAEEMHGNRIPAATLEKVQKYTLGW